MADLKRKNLSDVARMDTGATSTDPTDSLDVLLARYNTIDGRLRYIEQCIVDTAGNIQRMLDRLEKINWILEKWSKDYDAMQSTASSRNI